MQRTIKIKHAKEEEEEEEEEFHIYIYIYIYQNGRYYKPKRKKSKLLLGIYS
jgi:hypothetical protein